MRVCDQFAKGKEEYACMMDQPIVWAAQDPSPSHPAHISWCRAVIHLHAWHTVCHSTVKPTWETYSIFSRQTHPIDPFRWKILQNSTVQTTIYIYSIRRSDSKALTNIGKNSAGFFAVGTAAYDDMLIPTVVCWVCSYHLELMLFVLGCVFLHFTTSLIVIRC